MGGVLPIKIIFSIFVPRNVLNHVKKRKFFYLITHGQAFK